MAKIHVLPFEIANLIAAGEVVDRPASVVKELAENAIDAGADAITIEIKHGGVTFMRVTDNGCGMRAEDIPVALRRHATSKIEKVEDLDAILTLGFRGEALAAISSVAKVRILSKTATEPMGAVLECHGGEILSLVESGCQPGTTIIVEELFYNVPARRKFLKKDATEAAACTAVAEKIALSHPEIAVKYISDGEIRFSTAGDNHVKNVIYALFGREFALRALAADRVNETGSIRVHGFVSEPDLYRPNRNMEIFFINGRYVKSRTAQAAAEQAYASKIPHDKFPFCVLYIDLSPGAVDVNVHPAKLEVKFTNEKIVFDAVYYAVCNALESTAIRPELTLSRTTAEKATGSLSGASSVSKNVKKSFWAEGEKAREYLNAFVPKDRPAPKGEQIRLSDGSSIPKELLERRRAEIDAPISATQPKNNGTQDNLSVRTYMQAVKTANHTQDNHLTDNGQTVMFDRAVPESVSADNTPIPHTNADTGVSASIHMDKSEADTPRADSLPLETQGNDNNNVPPSSAQEFPDVLSDSISGTTHTEKTEQPSDTPPYLILGEAYNTYILVQMEDRLLMIDKHAAHERIIFDELCQKLHSRSMGGQILLVPLELSILPTEAAALTEYTSALETLGYVFRMEERSVSVVAVFLTQIPDMLSQAEALELFSTLVNQLTEGTGTVEAASTAYFETKLWQASCKAAIKGGRVYDTAHIRWLCDRLLVRPEKEGASVIRTCPHGRPVAFEIKKTSIERQFARLM